MIRNFIFSIFFFLGIILISIIFLPSFFLPQKVVLLGGRLMGYWTELCLKIFLSIKIIIKGKENIINNVKFDHDLEISFNSRYLIDVASQLDGERVEIFFNDTGSPALIKDPGDFDSIFVVMPMKG